jgi:hypothetical protein
VNAQDQPKETFTGVPLELLQAVDELIVCLETRHPVLAPVLVNILDRLKKARGTMFQ